jgi:ribonuclease Z
VLVRRQEVCLQFDAGRATAMRLAAAGVSCRDLDAVFLTHHHSDHVMDLPDLALSRWTVRDSPTAYSPLTVVAPTGPAARFAERMLDPFADDIAVRMEQSGRRDPPAVDCREFASGSDPVDVYRHGDVRVSSCAVRHEPVLPAVAYRVDTPEGSLVISGDTQVCREIAAIARGVDVLVHEVISSDALGPVRFRSILDYHARSVELGALCAELEIGQLVLTHLIPAPNDEEAERGYVADIRRGGYTGPVTVGRDLTRVELTGTPA